MVYRYINLFPTYYKFVFFLQSLIQLNVLFVDFYFIFSSIIVIIYWLTGNVRNHYSDTNGRKLLLNIKHNERVYTILNLYCPTNLQERIEFISENIAWVKRSKIDGNNLIIGGDMNCVDWPSDRKSFVTDKSSETLRKFQNSLNVTDMWK